MESDHTDKKGVDTPQVLDHPYWSLVWTCDDPVNSSSPKRIFLGNAKVSQSRTWLKKFEIAKIVNCTRCCENRFDDLEYLKIPLSDDHHQQEIIEKAEAVFEFLRGCTNESVLIHCSQGISRSATVFISWLIRVQRMSLRDSLVYVRSRRAVAEPNHEFLKQLMIFEVRELGTSSMTPEDLLPCRICLGPCFDYSLLKCGHRCCSTCYTRVNADYVCSHCRYSETSSMKRSNSVEDIRSYEY